MTEEIINSDGSRNWEANILLDNIKRLEQENKELKARVKAEIHLGNNYKKDFAEQVTIAENYRSALEEIKKFLDNSLMVTNVGTKQMIYYADFFEFKNDLKEKIDEVLNA